MFGSFLFADDFLDLADLFLNLTGLAFLFAFGFQVRIHVGAASWRDFIVAGSHTHKEQTFLAIKWRRVP